MQFSNARQGSRPRLPSVICVCLIVVLSGWPAYAAETPCSSPDYHAWDFWIGTWTVASQDGQHQGTNSISREEGTCLLVERWTSASGGTGQSYNYFNPGDQQWHQLWVSQGAIIDYAGKLNEAGAMQLEGEITYQASGKRERFKGQWTPQVNGTVLQELKQWDRTTKAWQDWFTGIYTKQVQP